MLSIVIGDPSSHSGGTDSEGMVVTVFRPRLENLPQVYRGQVILFRDILVSRLSRRACDSDS